MMTVVENGRYRSPRRRRQSRAAGHGIRVTVVRSAGVTPVRLVVVSPDRRRVLARPNGLAGWSLPAVPMDFPPAWTAADSERARRLLGADVAPVRRIAPAAWLVEPRSRVPVAGSSWIAAHELARLGADAGVAAAGQVETDDLPSHLRLGWYAELDGWVQSRFPSAPPVMPLRHWELSGLVRAGDVVVKQGAPGFDSEGEVLAAITGRDPAIPELLAAEGPRLATRFVPGPLATRDDNEALLAVLGRIHRTLAGAGGLTRDGIVPTVDAGAVAARAGAVVGRDGATELVSAAFERVAELPLAPTLLHADAHPGNLIMNEGGPVLIDWSNPFWGHPALDLRIALLRFEADDLPPRDALAGWLQAMGDPVPLTAVADRLPAIRVAGSALQVAEYDRGWPLVAPSLRQEWSGFRQQWIDGLVHDLDAFVATPA